MCIYLEVQWSDWSVTYISLFHLHAPKNTFCCYSQHGSSWWRLKQQQQQQQWQHGHILYIITLHNRSLETFGDSELSLQTLKSLQLLLTVSFLPSQPCEDINVACFWVEGCWMHKHCPCSGARQSESEGSHWIDFFLKMIHLKQKDVKPELHKGGEDWPFCSLSFVILGCRPFID